MSDRGSADPDSRARTHLANERTFLAWFRTGITLVALGLAASQLLPVARDTGPVRQIAEAAIVVVGASFVLVGWRRYHAGRVQIERGAFAPASASVAFATVVVVVIAVLALLVIAATPRA